MKQDNFKTQYLRWSFYAGFALLGYLFVFTVNAATVPKNISYPTGEPNADEIAQQVFFVNRFYAFANASLEDHPRGVAEVINIEPGKKPTTLTIERHINNSYQDGEIRSRELAIFRSGKLKGVAILMTDYVDVSKNPTYAFWLPALRRIRRIEENDYDKSWGGTVFTLGEISMRKPGDETHERLGVTTFNACLETIKLPAGSRAKNHQPICNHKGKSVYRLKSKKISVGGWYDYRISYVDTETFADYRTEYFKGDKKIKVIDRDWRSTALKDKRALQWHHLYGKDLLTGRETFISVPEVALVYDTHKLPSFWSESTLKKLKLVK